MNNDEVDTVMAEMHAIKDANSARFGHDLKRMFAHWAKLGTTQSSESAVCADSPVLPSKRKPRFTSAKGPIRGSKRPVAL